MAFTNTNDGYAPGLTTTVTVDVPDYALAQEPIWKSFQDLEITGGADLPGTTNMVFRKDIGWTLSTIHDTLNLGHDGGLLDSVVIPALTPGGFLSQPIKRSNSADLTGVPLGSQAASGDNFYSKNVKAGDDWSSSQYANTTDQSSYGKPSDPEMVPLDRVYTGNYNFQPNDAIYLRVIIPELAGAASIGALFRVYFCGIPSQPNGGSVGTGEYACSFFGDGTAYLWEKVVSSGAWTQRLNFIWSPPHQVAKSAHYIAISSDAHLDAQGNWKGRVITFQCSGVSNILATIAGIAAGLVPGTTTTTYAVPDNGSTKAVTSVPPRLDVRRDVTLLFQPTYSKYSASGALQTQTWTTPRSMGSVGGIDPLIYVRLYGAFPTIGSVSSIALYDSTGVACTPSGPLTVTAEWVTQGFQRNAAQQSYYAIINTAPDGPASHSPIIQRVAFTRLGVVSPGTSTPFTMPAGTVTDYSVGGASYDPTTASGMIGVISYQDGFTVASNGVLDPIAPLTKQSGKSVRIEVNGLPANGLGNTTSTLFLGKGRRLRRARRGVKRIKPLTNPLAGGATQEAWPSETWWAGKWELDGLWKRLVQSKTTATWNFADKDPATGNIYTVQKMVQLLLTNSGLPTTMYDGGADTGITIQADPNDKNQAFTVEVFTPAVEFCQQQVRDYFGATFVVDANATNGGGSTDKYGCLRLKFPPRPYSANTYLPLAQFVDAPNWTSALNRVMNLNAYAAYTRADGHTVPTCPVLQGTQEIHDEAPEGNCVAVFGTAAANYTGNLQQVSGNTNLWAAIHNWPAAQFYDSQPIAVDPTHPDYTDGTPNLIIVVDPTLNTQGAVNFATRRMFDMACHRRLYMRFEAPVVMVTDPLDTLQVRMRPLMVGDCVYYAGPATSPYWFLASDPVINTEGSIGGTRNATAIYELYQIPEVMFNIAGYNSVYGATQLYAPTGDLY